MQMLSVVLLSIVVAAMGTGVLVVRSLFGWLGPEPVREPDKGTEAWRRTDAEVVSVLRAGSRTFLEVRYIVGTSVVQSDVFYPVKGEPPLPGRRIPVRYDPAAPARVVFDVSPHSPKLFDAQP